MGEGSEWNAIGVRGKDTQFRSCQTHHVCISPQENRGGAAGEVGEGEGGSEEGGIELRTREEKNDSPHLQTEEEVYATCNRGGKTRP
jgi:hypothetical protein